MYCILKKKLLQVLYLKEKIITSILFLEKDNDH